jgi:hypothetical protein
MLHEEDSSHLMTTGGTEGRGRLSPNHAAKLVLGGTLLLLTVVEEIQDEHENACGTPVRVVVDLIFYTSLIFVVYQAITLVIKYHRNKYRRLFTLIDIFVLIIYLIIFVTATVVYFLKDETASETNDCIVDEFIVLVYMILGFIAVAALVGVVILHLLKRQRRKH